MPQIPDWTAVGAQTPTPSYRRVQPDESGEILAKGAGSLGQGLETAANDDYVQGQKLLAAKGENAVLDHRLAVQNAAETMRQQVASGDVPYDQARATFDQQVQQIPAPQFDGLNPVVADSLQRETQRSVAAAQFGIDGAVVAARKDDFRAQFGAGLDKLGKLAGMPDANIDDINNQAEVFRPLGRSAGLPEAYIDKTLQNFKDANWFNQATQRSMESKESLPALGDLQHDLTDQDGFYAGKLDTDKRNILLRGVTNDQIVLQNRLEHEQDKREVKAQGALRQIDEQISSGIPATSQMWQQWEGLTKGTTAEPDFQQSMKAEDQVQQVLRAPIDQQMKYVQDKASDLQQNGGSMRDRANLMRLQTAVNQNVNLLEKAPLLYSANRNGTEVAPLDLTSMATPDGQQAVSATISDRMATLETMRKQYGSSVNIQPLLPQETAQLTNQLQQSTPTQRAQLLTTLRNSFNNDDAYQAAMRQIAPRSPVTAIAGQMIGSQAPASTPAWFDNKYAPQLPDVERVLRGEALLNPAAGGKEAAQDQEAGKGAMRGGMPMPDDRQLRITYGQAANGLFPDRPQLADAHYSVFKSAYASLLAEKGDMKGTGDPALEQQALKIALGTPVDFNGSRVSVPSGMDPTRFNGLVRNAVADAASSMQAPPDWQARIRGYQIREVGSLGSGRYELTNGSAPLMRPDGKGPFMIDMHNQYLPGTPGATSGQNAGVAPLDPNDKVAMSRAAAQQPQQ